MAHVAICSLVRNGMDYLAFYRAQMENIQLANGDSWHLYVLEGDSWDDSFAFLTQWAAQDSRITVAKKDVGEPAQGEDRAVRWADAANACLDMVPDSSPHTHVLWLEPDLCFPPSELLSILMSRDVDIVAPMIYLAGVFYDTWGFRDRTGRRWTNLPPFHPDYRPHALIEMGSVGSCALFRRQVLDIGLRMKGNNENGLLVGLCNDARLAGFRVWADTGVAVLHPVDRWAAQMWRPESISIKRDDGASAAIPIPDASNMGLLFNLPKLDAESFLRGQDQFLANVCRQLQTSKVHVEVRARSRPQKRYDLVIRAHLGQGSPAHAEHLRPPSSQGSTIPITIHFED